MVREPAQGRRPRLVGVICLTCLVGFVFFPIVDFEFADLDVREHVICNPHVQGLTVENLGHIFTSRCIGSYYPVRSLSFAVDYHFAGLEPGRFKLTNGLIHLANVLLVYGLVLRLFRRQSSAVGTPGAWREVFFATFSAGVFAVHPVVVEPVTWVPGREELLMALGALGCIHFHLTARRLDEDHRSAAAAACYAGAAFCCAVACLSSAVAAVIPMLIVAWDLLAPARPKLFRMVYGTSAIWMIGAVTIVIKRLGDGAETSAQPAVFSAERLMLIPSVYWHNFRSVVWPTNLALCYDDLKAEGFLDAEVILGVVAVGATCFMFWKLRGPALFGLVWFGLALGPVSQIMPHHVYRADRFLYLPLVGLAVAIAMLLRPLGNALTGRAAPRGMIAAGVTSLALLGILSSSQVERWRSNLSLWEHCVKVAPSNPVPRRMLADSLASAGRFDLAIGQYQEALRLDPNNVGALNNFAWYLAAWDEEALRDYDLAIRLAERACELTAWQDLHTRSTLALACKQFAHVLEKRGQFGRAIQYYHEALEAKSDDETSLLDLVMLLATCSDPMVRNPDEAVRIARRACDRGGSQDPLRLAILAEACAEAGRYDEAVTVAEEAIQIAQAAGNLELAAELRRKTKFYQNGTPSYSMP